jgi:hypothetical protein
LPLPEYAEADSNVGKELYMSKYNRVLRENISGSAILARHFWPDIAESALVPK